MKRPCVVNEVYYEDTRPFVPSDKPLIWEPFIVDLSKAIEIKGSDGPETLNAFYRTLNIREMKDSYSNESLQHLRKDNESSWKVPKFESSSSKVRKKKYILNRCIREHYIPKETLKRNDLHDELCIAVQREKSKQLERRHV